jgi:acyl CoA:acetate/3-ketoacid CoA transferase beta subunit
MATKPLDGNNIAESVIAGTILLGMGAAGALAYEHRHVAKHHMRRIKKHLKKRLKR